MYTIPVQSVLHFDLCNRIAVTTNHAASEMILHILFQSDFMPLYADL